MYHVRKQFQVSEKRRRGMGTQHGIYMVMVACPKRSRKVEIDDLGLLTVAGNDFGLPKRRKNGAVKREEKTFPESYSSDTVRLPDKASAVINLKDSNKTNPEIRGSFYL